MLFTDPGLPTTDSAQPFLCLSQKVHARLALVVVRGILECLDPVADLYLRILLLTVELGLLPKELCTYSGHGLRRLGREYREGRGQIIEAVQGQNLGFHSLLHLEEV